MIAAGLWLAAASGPIFGAVAADEWLLVETDHLTIYTDADVDRGLEVAYDLERFRAVFAQLAPALDLEPLAPTIIFAFRDGDSFAPYKGRRDRPGASILGQFLSHPDSNYLTLDADPSHVGATAVLYHEYVHYFVRTNVPEVPLWFNEGLAEYYSTFETDGEAAWVGRPVARHMSWLARHGGFDLARVLETTGSGRHGASEAGELYAVSWLLVHHLMSGGAERLAEAATYLAAVADGDDSTRAFRDAFGLHPRDLEASLLESARLGEFAEARIPLSTLPAVRGGARRAPPADVLSHLGDLLAVMGRVEEAERHYVLALDHDASHARTHAGLAGLRDRQSRLAEADALFGDAIGFGLHDPLGLLRLGRHFLATLEWGDEAEPLASRVEKRAEAARRAFRSATELEPGFVEAHAMLGYAHAFGEAEPADGIPSLRHALGRVPGRAEWKLQLVQLLLRADRPEEAEAFIESAVGWAGEPEWVVRAREELARWRQIRLAAQALEDGDVDAAIAHYTQALDVTRDPALEARLLETIERLRGR